MKHILGDTKWDTKKDKSFTIMSAISKCRYFRKNNESLEDAKAILLILQKMRKLICFIGMH
jgi:hypothetical protein